MSENKTQFNVRLPQDFKNRAENYWLKNRAPEKFNYSSVIRMSLDLFLKNHDC